MKTLEEILQKYFGCNKPFLKNPKPLGDGFYEFLTTAGGKAYQKLTGLLEDLEALGVIEDAAGSIEVLDSIVRDEY